MKRHSRQRDVILEEVCRIRNHPSAQEIFDRVRRRLPKISLGTVYRNLEQLAAHGLIRKLELPGNQRRFDGDVSEHYHIRCLRCGRVEDLPALPWAPLDQLPADFTEYTVVGYRLELLGLCPACREAATSPSPSDEVS